MNEAELELHAEVLQILRQLLDGQRLILLAPYFDAFFAPVLRHLSECGAQVAGVLAWRSNPSFAAKSGLPILHLGGAFPGADPDSLEAALERLPSWVEDWIGTLDPNREAVILGNQFVSAAEAAGRPVLGWRLPRWAALEDKTLVGRSAAVARLRAPDHRVLERTSEGFPNIARRCHPLDAGQGIVVSACARGFDRGGSRHNAYYRSPVDWSAVAAGVPDGADRVRVSSFVAGTPCSVNGFVLGPGRTMVFDPIEIVTLLDLARDRFVFCGSSNRLRPLPAAAEEMRAAARQIATEIAGEPGFLGGFSIDGVWTDEGFLFTEINARPASGTGLRQAWPKFPLFLLGRAVMAAPDAFRGLSAERLERAIRDAVRGSPSHSVAVPAGMEREDVKFELPVGGSIRQAGLAAAPAPECRAVSEMEGDADGYVGATVAALASSLAGRRFADGRGGPAVALRIPGGGEGAAPA